MALRSILHQTFQEWELIVIDDGSSNETLAQLHRFLDERIFFLRDEYAARLELDPPR